MKRSFDYVLFDLGGVIIELKGWDQLLHWSRFSTLAELKHHWIHSPTVRRFETGQCSELEFGNNLVLELSLKISAAEFLRSFESWINALYPNITELLAEVSAQVPIATVSNTSTLHWKHIENWNFLHHFVHHFPSFQIGLHKPDVNYFHFVLSKLQVPAGRILFYDDKLANVEAAASVGIFAERVVGPDELRQSLTKHGFLSKH